MSASTIPGALIAAHLGKGVLARPRERQAIHRHSDSRLVLYLGGRMREEAFEGKAHFVRGEFVFRPAYFAHANVAEAEGSKYTRLAVSPRAVRRWIAQHGWRAARGRINVDRALHGDELLAEARPHPYALAPPATLMDRVARMLAGDAAPTVRTIAAKLDLEPYELTRRFNAEFGMTPSAWRHQARLQRALRMLAEQSASLAQIAQSAGYHDQSHLTVAFRQAFGLTPGVFARMGGAD